MEQPTDLEQQAAHIVATAINNAMVNAVHVFANWYACEYSHGRLTPDAARILARFFCQQQGWMVSAEPIQEKERNT